VRVSQGLVKAGIDFPDANQAANLIFEGSVKCGEEIESFVNRFTGTGPFSTRSMRGSSEMVFGQVAMSAQKTLI
jgi:hypothetical protein